MKKRTSIRSSQRLSPQFQYKDEATGYWVDAPWYVFSFHELRAFLAGLGIRKYSLPTRKIESYREAQYL